MIWTYDQDCDLIQNGEVYDCFDCYRYEICKKYFEEHPDEIYCPDDLGETNDKRRNHTGASAGY